MQKEFRLLLRNIIIYGFGNVSVKLVGLVLLPLYTNTKLLSVEEYGVMGMLDISAQVIIVIFSISLYAAYARWYWDKDYFESRRKIFFTCFSTLAAFAVILSLTGALASGSVSILLFDNDSFAMAVMLMMIGASMQPLIDFTLTQMRVEEKPIPYITFNIIRLITILTATIYFLKFRQEGILAIYKAQITGNILFLVLTSPYIFKSSQLSFSFPVLREIIRYSMPLALASLSNVLLVVFDRYVLNYKSTLLNVGIYTQGYKIANTTKIFIVTSVQLALAPAIFKLMYRPDHKLTYSRIMTWFTIIVVYFSLFLSLFGLEITKFFTTGTIYWEAYRLIPIFSLGIIFGMLKDVSVTGLQITKRTRIIGVFLSGIAIFNLASNMILIPVWGIYGAAFSSFISQFIFFILLYLYAQKYYPIPYNLIRVGTIIISGAIIFLAGSLSNDYGFGTRVIVKTTGLIIFPVLLVIFKVVDHAELEMIRALTLSIRNIFVFSRKEELEEKITRIDESEL